MAENQFKCEECDRTFTVRPDILSRYPGWTPRICLDCKNGRKPKKSSSQGRSSPSRPKASRSRASRSKKARSKTAEENLSRQQVLEKYTDGPQTGVFTDGACSGNPGPGGWGLVHVDNGEILAERHGHDPQTTNNRMELLALIHAYELLPRDAETTIYSDSNLCVQTINQWAAGWKRNGWKRKGGPVKNLELVQRAYELSLQHPRVQLRWIKAHDGSRWNEYADSLATAYLREDL